MHVIHKCYIQKPKFYNYVLRSIGWFVHKVHNTVLYKADLNIFKIRLTYTRICAKPVKYETFLLNVRN